MDQFAASHLQLSQTLFYNKHDDGPWVVSDTIEPTDNATFTVSLVNSQPKSGQRAKGQRRVIPADYEGLIGDLELPAYLYEQNKREETPPRNQPTDTFKTLCTGLSVSFIYIYVFKTSQYFKSKGLMIKLARS